MRQLAIICLVLCSCAAPQGRLNEGSSYPYWIDSDADMSRISDSYADRPVFHAFPIISERGLPALGDSYVITGACRRDGIHELHGGAYAWTAGHEFCHAVDRYFGGNAQAAIAALTPPNPNAHMAKRLRLFQEIADAGPDHWANLYRRFGREAIGGHSEILARLEAKGN